jgi:predicted nuclease of predicted toxin-antitoxin system
MHASEIGMAKASDEQIIERSLKEGAITVTLDADFHAILAVSGAAGPSVIRVRREGLDAAALAEVVVQVLVGYETELVRGSLITVKPRKTTCHNLPIGVRRDIDTPH